MRPWQSSATSIRNRQKSGLQKYFTDLPQGKPVQRPTVPLGKLTASKRLVYEDRVQVPRLYIQWPTVGFKHDDDYALSVMSSILQAHARLV